MSKVYNVKNLEEALELANNFKASGKYDLFRGQSQNWEVTPSAGRLTKKEHEKNIEKIKRLALYFENSIFLKKYLEDVDWFFSVAQHYGIPTHYIDFTSEPKVAAYFATNSDSNIIGKNSVIICLNRKDFFDLINFSKVILKKNDEILPYIVEPNTENLWRLKAQKGSLLFTPYINIEPVYKFDRIVFPYEKSYEKINKESIYPKNKSELEIQLDYFFNNEERLKREIRFRDFSNKIGVPVVEIPENNISQYLKNNKPCKSWNQSNLNKHDHTYLEDWSRTNNDNIISFEIEYLEDYSIFTNKTTSEIENLFISSGITKRTLLDIRLNLKSSTKIKKKIKTSIKQNFIKIWDGTRNLPYSLSEISRVISDYIYLELYSYFHGRTFSLSGNELIKIEMSNKNFSSSRAYASKKLITEAIRDDIYDVIIDSFPKYISSEILLYINDPRLIFNFDKLNTLFKTELIAYQIFSNKNDENPVIFYTPSNLEMLGYK